MSSTLIFTLSFLAAFIATVVILSWPLSSRARVRQSLDRLATYEGTAEAIEPTDSNLMEQMVWPLLNRVGRAGKFFSDADRLARTKYRLLLAGVRTLDAEKFFSIKLGFAVTCVLVYILFILPLSFTLPVGKIGLIIIPLGYYLPDFWLRQRIKTRQHAIAVALPDSIDLLTIGIEAGLAFDSALVKIIKNTTGPLSEELGRMLAELQVGVTRKQALHNLSERTTVQELQAFCATVIQAEKLGISISKILRNESEEVRTRRRQAAEEEAMKTPVKMVLPIVLFILPALLIVIVGPGIIRIAEALF